MARIVNYANLKEAVSEWLGRAGDTALANRADEFIALFESEFVGNPDMRTFEMQRVDTCNIDDTAPIALPADYLEMIRLRVLDASGNPQYSLEYVTPDQANNLDIGPKGGTCHYYTVLAGQIMFAPMTGTPVGDKLELAFYGFTPLSDLAPTNWLLDKYPNLYLYGSLMQAAAYIDDKETVGFWSNGLAQSLNNLTQSDRRRKLGAGPLIIRPSNRNVV